MGLSRCARYIVFAGPSGVGTIMLVGQSTKAKCKAKERLKEKER